MKQYQYQISGMNQDLAYQLFQPTKAFSCHNIRFTTTEDSSDLLGITNEKGNTLKHQLSNYVWDSTEYTSRVINVIGVCQMNEFAVLFAVDTEEIEPVNEGDPVLYTTKDLIYLFEQSTQSVKVIYRGEDMHFNIADKVQSIGVYENEEIIKIYFIDGKNTPKVINIASELSDVDAAPVMNQKYEMIPQYVMGSVKIDRTFGGRFHAGVIQYVFTYSNKNMQESNIWYVSPLYMVGNSNTGASAEDICNAAFNIDITNPDTSYEYVNIYGILRTSLEAEPTVYKISNLKLSQMNGIHLIYLDTGANWENYSLDELIQKQRSQFIPANMAQTENRLFMGGFTIKNSVIDKTDSDIADYINYINTSLTVRFDNVNSGFPSEQNECSTFRSNEYYRFGIQFKDSYGSLSNILYLQDILMPTLDPSSLTLKRKFVEGGLPALIPDGLSNYTHARLVMVDRTLLPKRTYCQGVLCPTLYRVGDRVDNKPFGMSSWNMRGITRGNGVAVDSRHIASGPDQPLNPSWDVQSAELQNQNQLDEISSYDYTVVTPPVMCVNERNYHSAGNSYFGMIVYQYTPPMSGEPDWYASQVTFAIFKSDDNNSDIHNNPVVESVTLQCRDYYGVYTDLQTLGGLIAEFENQLLPLMRQNSVFAYPDRVMSYIKAGFYLNYQQSNALTLNYAETPQSQQWTSGPSNPVADGDLFFNFKDAQKAVELIGNPFVCDHNIVTFHSPDVEKYGDVIDRNENIKCRIVGYSRINKHHFDYHISASAPSYIDMTQGVKRTEKESLFGTYNAFLWKDTRTYPVYIWNRSDSLGEQQVANQGIWAGQVEKKVMCNKHICGVVKGFAKRYEGHQPELKYFEGVDSVETFPDYREPIFPKIGIPRYFNSNETIGLQLDTPLNSLSMHSKEIYQGNVDLMHQYPFRLPVKDISSDTITGIPDVTYQDPIWIKYKSTPHIVLPLSYIDVEDDNTKLAPSLPYIVSGPSYAQSTIGYIWNTGVNGFLRTRSYSYLEDVDTEPESSILYVAELYMDLDADDIYPSPESSKVSWIPISSWVDMRNQSIRKLTGYGDTFIGNWDCLKTYAYSEDDIQSYKDVTSITLESDRNPAGRYDNYQNIDSILGVSPQNFNLFNDVYNQSDDIFTYRMPEHFLDYFPAQIMYSPVKTLGEEIDSWCQISPETAMDAEGTYGKIKALEGFNRAIYVFQENAVSKINNNTRVAITPTDGVPIQISNSNTVDSVMLLHKDYGVNCPQDIVSMRDTLFFKDSISHDLIGLNTGDNLTNISKSLGMHSYCNKNDKYFKGLLYDSTIDELYMQYGGSECTSLCYNTLLNSFTSFYDYYDALYMIRLGSSSFTITEDEIYEQRTGSYCKFFGEYKPFSIELMVNPEPLTAKLFTNVEFNFDSDNKERCFNRIESVTSYQSGALNLNFEKYNPCFLKRKLRIWRADIPRHGNSMDRMCDTWCKVKLLRNPVSEGNPAVYTDALNDFKIKTNYINIMCYSK